MTITQIQYFYTLSRFNSYSMAARQLYITQPALSRTITALEKELDIQLVNHSTRKMSLTPAGTSFAETCQNILQIYQDGIAKAKALDGYLMGQIRFGLLSEYTTPGAIKLIELIRERYPEVSVTTKFFNANGLLKALDDGAVDFIIASGWPRHAKLRSLLVYSGQHVIAAAKKHPLSGRGMVQFKELRNESFLIPDYMVSGNEFRNLVDLADNARFSSHLVGTTKTVSELITRVALGEGITVIPDIYVHLYSNEVVFIPLKEDTPYCEYIIWKENRIAWEAVIPDIVRSCLENL